MSVAGVLSRPQTTVRYLPLGSPWLTWKRLFSGVRHVELVVVGWVPEGCYTGWGTGWVLGGVLYRVLVLPSRATLVLPGPNHCIYRATRVQAGTPGPFWALRTPALLARSICPPGANKGEISVNIS